MNVQNIEVSLKRSLEEKPVKQVFRLKRRVKASLVQGTPWVEDLFRFPSSRIKVEFLSTVQGGEAAELSQEELFSLFRPYGRLVNVTSQPTDSKILPRYAYINFRAVRHAVMAKNCMHGVTVPQAGGGGVNGTVLRLGYEQIIKTRWMRDWLASHPRTVIPLIIFLVATTVSVLVLDPIRVFLIEAKITQLFGFADNKASQWFVSKFIRARDRLGYGKQRHKTDQSGFKALEDDRKESIAKIHQWLEDSSADSLFVIQGPRGSRKKEFAIHQALNNKKHVLHIDCRPIQEARGDTKTIVATAKQVGYWPVMLWMNKIINLIDITAQGMIRTKTDFSETLDSQLDNILENTSQALRKIALHRRKQTDEDVDKYLQAHPECQPVVVIDNFLHRSKESAMFYHKISEWAAEITRENIAHVILLTDDVSKSFGKAFPNCVFQQISLEDCSPGIAKRVVIDLLKEANTELRDDKGELDSCIEKLGGRITDLEDLARRIKSSETPQQAVENIIQTSASEILKTYIFDRSSEWSAKSAWFLVKALASKNIIDYNDVLHSEEFRSVEEASLQALEEAGLITITRMNGMPHGIKPGRPIYSYAFESLTSDYMLKVKLDLANLDELTQKESQSIEKYEAELQRVASLPKEAAAGLVPRIKWLGNRLQECQANLERYELESRDLKKTLQGAHRWSE
ncbi:mitochondrial escape protein 2 [Pseudocyphellaria aurata]|nr:mitochondrial escape protein 2 [Pseudocyphellaria aurata]